jgi:hypothetical protein
VLIELSEHKVVVETLTSQKYFQVYIRNLISDSNSCI